VKKITIKDICREAGVSNCTVSKVLNNKPRVGEKTRKRVRAIVDRLKYIPDSTARNLSRSKTDTIGVIFPKFGRGMFSQLLDGVEEVIRPHKLYILAVSSVDAADQIRSFDVALRIMNERRIDGIMLCNAGLSAAEERELRKYQIPIVVNERLVRGSMLDAVLYDNFKGGYEATKHLIEHGYERIATLTGPSQWESASERLRGYKTALKDYSLPVDSRLVVEGTWTGESSAAKFISHFRDGKWPEAIFAANDDMAMSLLKYISNHRDDKIRSTAIVGFDDLELADFAGLTTVHVPTEEIGRFMALRLLELIQHPNQKKPNPTVMTVPVQLVTRSSCGCLSSRGKVRAGAKEVL